jgi:hypothetical protein
MDKITRNKIRLARATGLIEGTQGALKHVLVYVADMSEEDADKTMAKTNEVLDEVKQLIKEIDDEE